MAAYGLLPLIAESPTSPSAPALTHSPLVCLPGTQITCFPPSNLSMRQAVYFDSFCWAAVQQQDGDLPLWLHKVLTYSKAVAHVNTFCIGATPKF